MVNCGVPVGLTFPKRQQALLVLVDQMNEGKLFSIGNGNGHPYKDRWS
jgi:hypothetical protein